MKGQDTTTLCAVGGLIVGAATLSLSSNAVIKQMLRGTERAKDGGDSIIGSDRVLVPPLTSVSSDKQVETSIDTGEKSIEEDVEILYEWRGEEPLNNMTLEDGQSMMYSERILKEIDNSISRRTNLFSSGGFRLKLFWKVGYYWQERYTETFWCMGCGDCKENDVMKLVSGIMFRVCLVLNASRLILFLLPHFLSTRRIARRRLALMLSSRGYVRREVTNTVWLALTCVYRS